MIQNTIHNKDQLDQSEEQTVDRIANTVAGTPAELNRKTNQSRYETLLKSKYTVRTQTLSTFTSVQTAAMTVVNRRKILISMRASQCVVYLIFLVCPKAIGVQQTLWSCTHVLPCFTVFLDQVPDTPLSKCGTHPGDIPCKYFAVNR